jgi:hypothetical protein
MGVSSKPPLGYGLNLYRLQRLCTAGVLAKFTCTAASGFSPGRGVHSTVGVVQEPRLWFASGDRHRQGVEGELLLGPRRGRAADLRG